MDMIPGLVLLVFLLIAFSVAVCIFRRFRLEVKAGRTVLWQDEKKNLRIDVSVGFYNTGDSAGSVESVILLFHRGDKVFQCRPDMVYRFGDEGKLVPDGFWDPFLLLGKQFREGIIGFQSDIFFADLPDGDYPVTLSVRYRKNLRRHSVGEVSRSLTVPVRRSEVLRNQMHRQSKKQPFFPFDPAILQGLFSPGKQE